MNQKFAKLSRLSTFFGLICCLLVLLSISLVGDASENKVSPQNSQTPDVPNEGAKLFIRSQSDSPLVLIAKSNILPPTKTLQVGFVVKNVSKKSIRAYAIRHDVLAGGTPSSGSDLSMIASKKSLFLPGQSRNEEVGGSDYFPVYIDSIKISVDFVEFDDGSIWGPDTYKSAERIEGWRAGAKEMRKQLAQILDANDIAMLIKEVEVESFEITSPSNKSEVWVRGFKSGAASIRARVRNVPKKGDREEIEKAIKNPIDASEGGQ